MLDDLGPDDRARGLTKSLAWIATECEGQPPRRPLPSLHDTRRGPAGLRTWLRETIEVRDADGAERILRTLAEDHGPRAALDAVLACCTDHRYCDGGHTLDFAVKCAALADAVTTAATRRILRFGTANEVPDWDTVHHTQTYANAIGEGLRRAGSRELFRGVLDGAMSVYLDRFLNLPSSRLPEPLASPPKDALATLLELYDRRASVDEVAAVAHTFLEGGGDPGALFRTLGHAVMREDAGFHDYQQVDIAWRRRAQEQTCAIALRLHRDESLYE